MADVLAAERRTTRADGKVSFYGVHHLALNTDDMKMTVDFYVGVLGMRLVHAMKVPPGLGTGPGNRGNPPFEEIRHYFFDMGRDGLLAFFEMPKGRQAAGRPQRARRHAARLVCGLAREPSPYPCAARGAQGALRRAARDPARHLLDLCA
jgi:catechol 2,3-dioxygenase-like lactoylglutathione lyase family enzyme